MDTEQQNTATTSEQSTEEAKENVPKSKLRKIDTTMDDDTSKQEKETSTEENNVPEGELALKIPSSIRRIVSNVIKFCKEEANEKTFKRSITERASMLTGMPEDVVCRIKEQATTARTFLDEFNLCSLRKIINSFYLKKELPTLRMICSAVEEELKFFEGKKEVQKMIRRLGFRFKDCNSGKRILMQRHTILLWRTNYLEAMRENDEEGKLNKPVIYVSEVWIHPNCTVDQCKDCNDDKSKKHPKSKGERRILVHAGGKNGFIPGAGQIFRSRIKSTVQENELNAGNFTKWIEEKLLPNLPPSSMVVLDNSPYHCLQMDEPPSEWSPKIQIQEWLKSKQIPFEESLLRFELLQLVKSHKSPPTYKIDEILNKHGHKVVRLPPHHADLSPIEYVWNILKQRLKDINLSKSTKEVEKQVQDAIETITSEDWQEKYAHVKSLEQKYWNDEYVIEEETDNVIAQFGGVVEREISVHSSDTDDEMSASWMFSSSSDDETFDSDEFFYTDDDDDDDYDSDENVPSD